MVKNVKAGAAPVRTFMEWNALPEITFPVLKTEIDAGSAYDVYKVGWLLADPRDCTGLDIPPEAMAGGKVTLPTAVVELERQPQLCKLPIQLGAWAFDQVALAQAGQNLFPSKVEFGVVDGRHYAEFL